MVQAAVSVREQVRHLLVGAAGAHLGRVVAVEGEELLVGRAPGCGLWLNDPGISRHQARLWRRGAGYVLEDSNSANGTYVGGERISRIELSDSDVIQFGPSAVFRYSITDAQQEAMLRHLYDASVTDALTGIRNRESLDQYLRSELSYARRHDAELALLLIDIDHFKRINDTFGHQCGDKVLVELTQAISQQLRAEDMFARYGGEEFAIVLRGTELREAAMVGERVRRTVERMEPQCDGQLVPVRVSIGCATLACCAEATGAALVEEADRRLYEAKRGGRNRVVARPSDAEME